MSCHRFQFALSESLDGRLPSAKRAEVMAHVDSCDACTEVWQAMQSAQSLVLGLDEPKVTVGFRESVWDRIHSGEGSPSILLQEPVSVATKVRYGLLGATAAAAFLFGVNYLFSDDGATDVDTGEEVANNTSTSKGEPANAERDDSSKLKPRPAPTQPRPIQPNPLQPESRQPDSAMASTNLPFMPNAQLTTSALASETVTKVTTAAKRLRKRGRLILDPHNRRGPQGKALMTQATADVRTVDMGLALLIRLKNRGAVVFEPGSQQCVSVTRNILLVHRGNAPDQMRYMIKSLQTCSLQGLDQLMVQTPLHRSAQPIVPMFDDPTFQALIRDLQIMKGQMWQLQLNHLRAMQPGDPGQQQRHVVMPVPKPRSLQKRSSKK